MTNFPQSSEDFYALRDDRTDKCRVDPRYQRTHCTIHIGPESAGSLIGQTILVVSANLLSRWCRQVTIVMPPTRPRQDLNVPGDDLAAAILAQMHDADPFGAFEIQTGPCDSGEIALRIGEDVGTTDSFSNVFVNASGWYASISRSGPVSIPAAPDSICLGAIAAACLGIAQVFKMAISTPGDLLIRDGIFDLFRLAWVDCPDIRQGGYSRHPHFGSALMVGAGSVGSAAAYCMRLADIAGKLTIVDGDVVKIENFNRSPTFGRGSFGLNKADAVARHLSTSSVIAMPDPQWWHEYIVDQDRATLAFDVWLPLANEFGVRWSIQNNVPPLMIHASTSANWGVNFGRHIPGRDDCLADRFPDRIEGNQLTCSTGQVASPKATIDAALPFSSLFAGLLVVADLVRAQLPDYPQVPNFALLDLGSPLDIIQIWDRRPDAQCVCRGQHKGFHQPLNSGTKYWPIFEFN